MGDWSRYDRAQLGFLNHILLLPRSSISGSLKLGVEKAFDSATKKGVCGVLKLSNRNTVQSGEQFSTGDAWQQRVAVDGLCVADAVLMLFTCAHRSI